MEDGNYVRYLPLLKASLNGDWITANKYFEEDPSVVSSSISSMGETPLHAAISAGSSCDFIRKLVDIMPVDSLSLPNMFGNNPLHYAAIAGHTDAVKILVEKDPRLTLARNIVDLTPVYLASEYAHKETVLYLLSVTLDESPSPFDGPDGVKLLNSLIICEFYDLVEAHTESNGNNFGFLRDVHDTILMKRQAKELLRLLISEAYKLNPSAADFLLGSATLIAAEFGTCEFVRESINSNPSMIFFMNAWGRNIFHIAIIHRHEKIFNLLYQMGIFRNLTTSEIDKLGNSMLHLAGKLAPSNKISGAALQIQRELQWFKRPEVPLIAKKEVEKIVQPSFKEMNNNEGKTPRMVFTNEHKDLLEKGEKWMKDTASQCATVAALIVTVMFAAAFTAPGGNNSDKGIPILLNHTSFLIFAVSDALGLISSSTSLLMFLGILTSRCAEKDFLRALPMRMSIGLITLFCSMASMLTSFCATFYLVLFETVTWIAAPICLVACVPVILFALLQFPLLVEITYSTFGPSIFGRKHQNFIF